MKAGCYLSIMLLAGIVLGEHYWLQRTLDWPELWIATGVLAFITWLGIGALWNAVTSGSTLRALKLARDGALPQDGRLAAISGVILPAGSPLSAPLSNEPCVLYEFELTRRQTRSTKSGTEDYTATDFAGIGMAPCEVRVENQAIALYGFPDLDAIPSEKLPPDLCRGNAQRYVRETDWEDCTGLNLFRGMGAMLGALTSTGEEIRRNWRMIKPNECDWLRADDDPERGSTGYFPTLSEKRVPVGEPLIAIGVYDEASQSLSSRPGTTFQRLQLMRGELAEHVRRLSRSRRNLVIGGVVTLILTHLIAVGVMTVYRNSDETKRHWRSQFLKAVLNGDAATVARYVPDRLSADELLDDEHRTALFFAKDAAVAKVLIDRGANVNATTVWDDSPVLHMARHGHCEVLPVLIEAGADLNHARRSDPATPLTEAIRGGHTECAAILEAAGAK